MDRKTGSWWNYAIAAALPLLLSGCPTPPPFLDGEEPVTDGNTAGNVVTDEGGVVGPSCEVTCPEDNGACWTKCQDPETDVPPQPDTCEARFDQCLASCKVVSPDCADGKEGSTTPDDGTWNGQCQMVCEGDYKRCVGGQPPTCETELNSCLGGCYDTLPCDCGADQADCACTAPYSPDCENKCYDLYDNCNGIVGECTTDADCGKGAICIFDGNAGCPQGALCDPAEAKMPAMLGHCQPIVISSCDEELKGCLNSCYSTSAGGPGTAEQDPFVAPDCEGQCYEAYDACNGTVTTPCEDKLGSCYQACDSMGMPDCGPGMDCYPSEEPKWCYEQCDFEYQACVGPQPPTCETELDACLGGCYVPYPCDCDPTMDACACPVAYDAACEQKCFDIYDSCTGAATSCYADIDCQSGEICVRDYPSDCPAGQVCALKDGDASDAMPVYMGHCEPIASPCDDQLNACLTNCSISADGGAPSEDMPMPPDTCYQDCKIAYEQCLGPQPFPADGSAGTPKG